MAATAGTTIFTIDGPANTLVHAVADAIMEVVDKEDDGRHVGVAASATAACHANSHRDELVVHDGDAVSAKKRFIAGVDHLIVEWEGFRLRAASFL